MLNIIWLGLIVIGVLTAFFGGNVQAVTDAAIGFSNTAIEICLGLIGTMTLWLGLMAIAEKSGLTKVFGKALSPVMKRLFRDVPEDHPAMGAMVMNIAANVLGLGNAATPLGIKAMKELDSLNDHKGVATDAIQCDPARPTGVMFKSRRDDGGDPQTQYYRAGSAASALAPGDLDRVAHHRLRHLHVSGISAALGASVLALCHHAIDRARAQGATVSFDPNLRPALWPDPARMRTQIDALAARCDWLLIGIGEAEQLIDSRDIETIAAHYLGLGSGEVVIKLGADGAALRSRDARFDTPALAVAQVVDTVGAGDAFACGFISARLDGLDARGALTRGNAFGARAVQHPGDYESLPRRDELTADLH